MAVIREDHVEQIERWAKFVKENPTKWKASHTEFINAIFFKRQDFEERLLKMPNGKEKLKELSKRKL